MSANNFLQIEKTEQPNAKYVLTERDADEGTEFLGFGREEYETLEEAIKAANEYQKENEVEYGLQINL